MDRRIPPCFFCSRDLRGVKRRIIVDDGPRGQRIRWGCCTNPECLEKFRERGPASQP